MTSGVVYSKRKVSLLRRIIAALKIHFYGSEFGEEEHPTHVTV